MTTVVKFEGGRELEAALKKLVDATGKTATGKAAMRRALGRAAEPIRDQAQPATPTREDPTQVVKFEKGTKIRRVGTAHALMQAGTKLTPRQAAKNRIGKSAVEYYVGSRDPIARLLEFGTSHTPALGILRNAWDANKGRALEIIKVQAWIEIDKTAKRAAKKAAKSI